ncbi:hypothetical protein D3C72_244820 [compost metagenome]
MTEEEYIALLDRIVKGAEYLDNPMIKPEKKADALRLYDSLCECVRVYHERSAS